MKISEYDFLTSERIQKLETSRFQLETTAGCFGLFEEDGWLSVVIPSGAGIVIRPRAANVIQIREAKGSE